MWPSHPNRQRRLWVEELEVRRFLAGDLPPLLDIHQTPSNESSTPDNLVDVGGRLFFIASTPTDGRELWQSDSTAVGTVLIKDIHAGVSASDPDHLTNVNGTLYFTADDGVHGIELWRSDGTDAGTVLVKDIHAGVSSSVPNYLTNVNGTLYFTANAGADGVELWRSDGTDSGTVLVKDIHAGTSSSDPSHLTNVNGTLYFTADSGVDGIELWQSDGTDAGTVLIKDIHTGASSSVPNHLTNVNGTLYFTADNGVDGIELWRSDGTDAGTVLVKDIHAGANSSVPNHLTNVNGAIYFTSDDGVDGVELWRSDGTDAGTVLVKDIHTGSGSSTPQSLTIVGGTFYFTADNGVDGVELWRSDGTDAGTVLVKDIYAGSGSSAPHSLTNVNGTLYFAADDGVQGVELWRSDGTDAGTVLTLDIASESGSSDPSNLTVIENTLFFTARTDSFGLELYALALNRAPTGLVLLPAEIAENVAAGSPVGTLSTTDPDTGDAFSYTLVAGSGDTDNSSFTITGDQLTINVSPDFESQSSYSLRVRATDQGGLFTELEIVISITDVNETPTALTLSGTSLVENVAAGSPVGTLSTTDPDAGDAFSYTLVAGSGDTDNSSFTITGDQLTINTIPDFETQSNYRIRVRTTDAAGLWLEELFTIDVNNVAPTMTLDADSVVIEEGSLATNGGTLGNPGNDAIALTATLGTVVDQGNGTWRWTIDTTGMLASTQAVTVTASDGHGGDSSVEFLLVVVSRPVFDIVGTGGNDTFIARYAGVGTNAWTVTRDGVTVFSGTLSTPTTRLRFLGGEGLDTVEVRGRSVADSFVPGAGEIGVNGFVVQGNSVETWRANGDAGNDSFSILDGYVGEILGGIGTDRITGDMCNGNQSGNVWSIQGTNSGLLNSQISFQTVESLEGGSLDDTFVFAAAGKVSGVINGGQGFNQLDYSARTVPATITLQTAKATGTGGIVGIHAILGSAAPNDVLVGRNTANVWNVSAANAGTLNANGLTFSGFENLTGGTAADRFVIEPTGTLAGAVSGGNGTDRLELQDRGARLDVSVSTTSRRVLGAVGSFTLVEQVTALGSNVDQLIGGAANTSWLANSLGQVVVGSVTYMGFETISAGNRVDTLTGPAANADWTMSGENRGQVRFGSFGIGFSGVENLTGGVAADRFTIEPTGSLTGAISGGSGADRLDLQDRGTALDVAFSPAGRKVPGVIGSFTLVEQVTAWGANVDQLIGGVANTSWQLNSLGQIVVGSVAYTGFEEIVAGSGVDTLTGPAVATDWTISGENRGLVRFGLFGVGFWGVENLAGGLSADWFVIEPLGSLTGRLDGGSTGLNSLSYADWTTGVTVNLETLVPANATAIAGVLSKIAIVSGGSGNDILAANGSSPTVLFGDAGSDTLTGSSGRDILIGGLGADVLAGGNGEDILVGGCTGHDAEPQALTALVAEWGNTARNFATRVDNLRGIGTGPRLNGDVYLNVDTVFADLFEDLVTGGTSHDWFWSSLTEITDLVNSGSASDDQPIVPDALCTERLRIPTTARVSGSPGTSFVTKDGKIGRWGPVVRHHYVTDSPFNANGTLLWLENGGPGSRLHGVVLDVSKANEIVTALDLPPVQSRWDPRPAHAFERIVVTGAKIFWVDARTTQTVRSWDLPFAINDLTGKGNPSADGMYIPLLGDGKHAYILNAATGKVGPAFDLTNDCGLVSCEPTGLTYSPDGKYLLVGYPASNWRLFDVDRSTLTITPHAMPSFPANCPDCSDGEAARGFLAPKIGHSDFVLGAAGETYVVSQSRTWRGKVVAGVDAASADGRLGSVLVLEVTTNTYFSPTAYEVDGVREGFAHHFSGRACKRPGWVYVSYLWAPSEIGKRFAGEIVALELKTGNVERLGTHNSTSEGCYRCEPHATPSLDGRHVVFASTWGEDQSQVGAYLIQVD